MPSTGAERDYLPTRIAEKDHNEAFVFIRKDVTHKPPNFLSVINPSFLPRTDLASLPSQSCDRRSPSQSLALGQQRKEPGSLSHCLEEGDLAQHLIGREMDKK